MDELNLRDSFFSQFAKNLEDNETATSYIKSRGLDLSLFQNNLGYCSPYSKYLFPLLRGRIIVPINDVHGRLIALAGRQIPQFENLVIDSFWNSFGTEPAKAQDRINKWLKGKWINVPYQKSKHLFNLDQAKHSIRENNYVILVEGYFDVLILQQYGIKNVVALCGTALSEHHLALLFRYCDQVVLMLDGDEAGILASEKMLDKIENNEMIGYRLVLPEKYDPDSFLLEFGVDIFKDIIVKLLANKNRIMKIKI
jgi:DNA primase